MVACIFDMDGVISDTQKIYSSVESELLREYGIHMPPAEITRRFSGVSGRDMWPEIFHEARKACPPPQELSNRVWQRMLDRPLEEITEISGASRLISMLRERDVPLAVASGSRLVFIERVLTTLVLKEHFMAIASSQEVVYGKPAPDVFLLAAARLGVPPSSCVVIEDGINGMHAARSAGMYCIGLVADDGGGKEYPADSIVRSLAEIPLGLFGR